MCASGPAPDTSGFLGLDVTTRSFAAPLFGRTSVTAISVNGGQHFADGSDWTVGLFSGFPASTTLFSAEGYAIPLGEGLAEVRLGDFNISSQLDILSASYTVTGALMGWQHDRERMAVYAGVTKYAPVLTGELRSDPRVLGFEYGRELPRGRTVTASLLALADALTPNGRSAHALGRLDFQQELTPLTTLFASGYLGDGGSSSTAVRAGARFRSFRGEATAAAFAFGRDLPLLYPVVRPGERGAEVSGSWRFTEYARGYGAVGYGTHSILKGEDFRGHLGWTYSFGTEGPIVDASYHHDELTHDLLTGERESVLADRVAVSIGRYSALQSLAIRMDHVMRRGEPSRTQVLGSYSTLLANEDTLSSSATLQQEASSAFGATADVAYEARLRWPYAALFGIGVAYVESGTARGDGIVRFGVSRRLSARNSGWFARLEGRTTFSIGLPRSNLASSGVIVSVGKHLGWSSMANARTLFTSLVFPPVFGSVEGRVTADGNGLANVPVLLNGELRTTTASDGSYRVTHVPAGVATLSLQSDALPEGLSVRGTADRQVLITDGPPARADFLLSRSVMLVGSLVTCDTPPRGFSGAELALVGTEYVQTTSTSAAGGFSFDSVPPGRYVLVIDPASVRAVPEARLPRTTIDLQSDVFGRTVVLGCEGVPERPAPEAAGEIQGIARLNGRPAVGVAVLLDGIRRAVTAADGAFRFPAAPGEHVVSLGIDPTMQGPAIHRVTVGGSGAAVVQFDIGTAVRFEGALVACDGRRRAQPLAGITVRLLGPQGFAQAVTGPDGRFVVAALPPGRYLVVLDPEELAHNGIHEPVPRLLVDAGEGAAAALVSIGCGAK